MARYTVLWPKKLEDEYVDFWLRSDSERRKLLTRASHLIQAWLGNNPENVGAPVGSTAIRAWILPLKTHISVLYHVNEPDRRVTIVRLTIRE